MADNIIGIKFGVAGGKGFQAGSSGALIKEQLEYIASRIKLKVNVNKTYFKNQLSSLKKELDKTLGSLNIKIRANVKPEIEGGNGSSGGENDAKKQEVSYEQLRSTLEKLYQTKAKLLKLSDGEKKGTVGGTLLTRQAEELNTTYKEQLAQLKELLGKDDERVKKVQSLERALKRAYKAQSVSASAPAMANETALAKLDVRAQSLYTDNGFNKIIARSKKAAAMVDEFRAKVQAALNQKDSVTKDEVAKLNTEFLNTQARLKEIGRETDTLGNKIKETFGSRVIQRIAQTLLLTLLRALKQVYDNVKKIDTAMTELKIVTEATSKQMNDAAKNISKAAREIGTSIADLTQSTTVYARLGYDLKDAQTLAEKTTIYAKVAGVNVNEATTNITGIIKAFNIGADGLESVLDQLIWIGNSFPISQAEIGEAMNNAASALAANGNSLQQAIAIVSAANATIQDVSKSSTAVRTIAARISKSTAELEELGEDAGSIMATADLAKQMQAYGVAILDSNGQLKSTYAILNDLSKVWDDLDTTSRAAIANMFAGTRQQAAFYSIIQNWSDAQEIVADAGAATGSLMDAQATRLDSIEGKLEQLQATWETFSQNILNSGIVKFFVDLLKWVAEVLNAITGFGDGIVPKIAIIVAALAGLNALIPKLATLLDLAKLKLHLLKMEAGTAGASIVLVIKTIGTALLEFMKKNAPLLVIGTLITLMTSLSGITEGIVEVVVPAILLITAIILMSLKSIDTAVKGFMASNPIGWILAAITAVVMIVKGIIDLVKSLNPSYDDLKEKAKECKDAWEETKNELDEVKNKIKEVQEAIDELNSRDKLSIVDQADLEKLEQQLAILQQEEAVKETETRAAQREAMNSAEKALDKYKSENTIKDNNGNVIKTFDSRIGEALKDYRNSKEREWAQDTLKQYGELLDGFEYGMNEKLDSYFDEYYQLLDMYTTSTESSAAAWKSIVARIKNKDAIEALRSFADTFSDTSKITGDSLKELAQQTPAVQELFDYLKTVGMWDGTSWDDLTGLVGDLRTKLVELAAVNIVDDIEAITDKFDALSDALSDVDKNGIVSLGTLQTLMDKYPSLLNKYFNRDLDGYKLSGEYQGQSDFDILQDMAITSLKEYQTVLEDAKKTLAGLTQEDDDYETALKNLATAQDNLNMKEIEWASLLRESAISEETTRLEKMQDALEDQLDIYKELIDIRKDLLKTYQEELSYQKELSKKQKTVADLQTQLSLAKLDKSAAGQARARELESQLQEAQEELDEYTLERAIDDITTALDNEYNEYEQFIQEQVELISTQITEIATTLGNILSGVEGLTNTQFTGTEMYELYSDLKNKEASGMSVTGDARTFMDKVAAGDYNGADQYYVGAKTAADSYTAPTPQAPQKSGDELLAEQMTKLKGAWGSGIKANNYGDNGEVVYNGKKYYIESGGDDGSLWNAAYKINGYGDRDIFYYNGELYGCLDDSIVKLKQRAHSYKANSSEGYVALKKAVEAAGIYHTGGFVGDITSLKSNEEFAKLLNGEFVSTPKQMDTFMKKTLPTMLSGGGGGNGATINNNSPLIEIKCGDVDEDTLPKLKSLVDQAATKIEKKMESALTRTGYKKKF